MPFVQLADYNDPKWTRLRRRVLLTGQPNSGKTTSLLTFLETTETRMAYLAYPDEHGVVSLPLPHPQIAAFVWEEKDPHKRLAWANTWQDVETVTADILAGRYGKIDVFAGDGLHKLHFVALCKATKGEAAVTLDFDAILYAEASRLFTGYLHRVLRSEIGLVVFTVWEGWEKENPYAKDKNTTKHIFPALPGKLAKEIMGEFGTVLYATRQGVGPGAQYVWQTRPFGSVWGCGIKAPLAVTAPIKTYVPQDWRKLWGQLDRTPSPNGPIQYAEPGLNPDEENPLTDSQP